MPKRSIHHTTNLGIGEWTSDNHWSISLEVDNRGNVRSAMVCHSHTKVPFEAWPTLRRNLEPFEDLIPQLAALVIDCAALGWQEPLPGMRIPHGD